MVPPFFISMKKLFYMTFFALAVCSCGGGDDNDTPYNGGGNNNGNKGADVAITGTVTNITDNSAQITGTVNLGSITINYSSIEYGVQLSTEANFKITSTIGSIVITAPATALENGVFTKTVKDLYSNTKYYYRTYVKVQNLEYYGQTLTFTTEKSTDSQETDSHEYVDLGFPSGILWATCNVGATVPGDPGLYYAWGETKGYTSDINDGHLFDISNYKWCNGNYKTITKYCTDSSFGTVDNKKVLDLEDDAAYVNWGGKWRMPTDTEINELIEYTTITSTTQDGIDGYRLTSWKNGKSIFFPCGGFRENNTIQYRSGQNIYPRVYLWSSNLYLSNQSCASVVIINYTGTYKETHFNCSNWLREDGIPVRPVRSK